MPFQETIAQGRHEERFDPDIQIEERGGKVRLRYEHGETVGGMISRETRADGIHGVFKVSETRTGDDVLALAKDGNLGLSLGFIPVESRMEGRVKVQTRIDLREVSAVGIPAYAGAEITAVRSKEDPLAEETKEETPVVEKFDSEEFEKRLEDQLETRMREYIATAPKDEEAKPKFTGKEVLEGMLIRKLSGKALENRALDDVIGDLGAADASGVLYDQFWSGGLVGFTDSLRPLFSRVGAAPFPSGGYGLVTPRRTQTTVVGEHTPEKSEVPSQAYQADQQTFDMKWFAGAVDISMQLIEQSNPSIMSLVVDDLLSQYARATEGDMVTQTEAAATATGSLLDFTDYGTFITDVINNAEIIRSATGVPGNWLALGTASWVSLLSLLDGDNRRILATVNPRNADGSANFLSQDVNVGGINCFHSFDSNEDLQYNQVSLRNTEKAPMRVEQNNVALMGRDVGVLGATIVVPLDPTGILAYRI